MASNVSIETDAAGNWKPSKKGSERTDDLIMGLARAATQPVDEGGYWTPEMGVSL